MADGGGWHGGPAIAFPRSAGEATCERFQAVLSEFAQRLASPEPMRRETAVSLVQQLDRLGRRMAADQESAIARIAELDTALGALTARLEAASGASTAREADLAARIDRLVVELTDARNTRRPPPIRIIVAAAAACAALGGATAGVVGLTRQPTPERVAPAPLVVAEAPAETPIAAPIPVLPAAIEPPAAPGAKPDLVSRDTYASVGQALIRGDLDAVAKLTTLATAGDVKAQLRLALLYEIGDHALPRDLEAARLWTLRAASGGDGAAMFNAGQFLLQGEGGPKDPAQAATWFRRAARKGVVDAQYNLGLMFETGHGVARNPREALKWFALAAKAGDATARDKQLALEGELAASPALAAEPSAPDTGVPGASVSETQAYLSQQGYYIGPIDGVVTPELRAAASAYMKDRPAIAASR